MEAGPHSASSVTQAGHHHARVLLVLVLAASGACRSNKEVGEPNAPAPKTPDLAPATATIQPSAEAVKEQPLTDDFRGTAGILEKERPGTPPRRLKAVRTGRHEHYDRLVFEFAEGVPGYHLEYIDEPVRRCGSGQPTPLAGDAWLEIRLTPADAHTPDGTPTVAERERALELGVFRELELTCDFEGHVTWVLGVATPGRYRVLEFEQPPRLVVDVHH